MNSLASNDNLTEAQRQSVVNTLNQFVAHRISCQDCANRLSNVNNGVNVVSRLMDIMRTNQERPMPDTVSMETTSRGSGKRKKAVTWSINDDKRLIMAVNMFGKENWPAVSRFVGGGRTRGQCAQRWTRVIDPKISKQRWTENDDKRLCGLVEKFGEKSWMRVAQALGNRSDVQCRYRYQQITGCKKKTESEEVKVLKVKDAFDFLDSDPRIAELEQYW